MVNTKDLKSFAVRLAGSSPARGTTEQRCVMRITSMRCQGSRLTLEPSNSTTYFAYGRLEQTATEHNAPLAEMD